jgi:hypothetical protein
MHRAGIAFPDLETHLLGRSGFCRKEQKTVTQDTGFNGFVFERFFLQIGNNIPARIIGAVSFSSAKSGSGSTPPTAAPLPAASATFEPVTIPIAPPISDPAAAPKKPP